MIFLTQCFSSKKTNERILLYYYETSGRLVFVRFSEKIEDTKKTFRNYLSFRCTVNDLKMIIRLITRNFRIQNRVKYILEAVRALETDEILKTEDFSCKICHFCPIYHHDK